MTDVSTDLDAEVVEPTPTPTDATEEPVAEEVEEQAEELEAEADAESDEEDAEAEGEGDEEGEPEVDEFEFGGNKLELPKGSVPDELKAEIEKFSKGTWADYTRRSQEVAEQEKSIKAREESVANIASMSDDVQQKYARGLYLKQEIEQLSQVNMQELWQSDPDQARQMSDHLSSKQAELQSTIAEVSQGETQFKQAQQQEIARRSEEGEKQVEKYVKGFGDKASEVVDYATKTYGISKEDAEMWRLNPATAAMAYKAMMFDRMQAKAKKPATAKKAAVPVKPMKAKGQVNATKDPDKMSSAEWLKWRNAQLAKQKS